MPLPTGTKAPDFTLRQKTADGLSVVTLSSHFGKQPVVLLFFLQPLREFARKRCAIEAVG